MSPLPQSVSADAAPSAADSLLETVGSLLTAQWWVIPVLLVAGWIGLMYAWRRWQQWNAQRGRAVAGLGSILGAVLRFALREDRRPLISRPAAVAAKVTWLTGTRFYLALLALSIAGALTPLGNAPIFAAVLFLTLWARLAPVMRARRAVLTQMFAVAAAECRYPKGAELSPWGYINIQSWDDLVRPGATVVTYPAAYQSEDVKTREKFERQFNGTISEDNTWTYKWESSKNRVVCQPTSFLPTMAHYPGPGPKWNQFVLGAAGEGAQAVWDVSVFPHALICGPTGSGKSVLQRMILFHALAHSDTWKIVGVDPKMVEMGWLKKYPNVLKIALSLEDGVEVVQSVRDEMMRRYDEMSELGVNHFQDLDNPPPALLCMVDETFNFLAPEGIKSDEGKERDALHARGSSLLGEIARLGRAAGIHLALATQRPDATVIKGEMKNNLDCRIAAGRLDTMPSLMVMDSEAATRLPKIKGRGMIRLGGDTQVFQGYFAPQDWYDSWLLAQAAADTSDAPVGSAAADSARGEAASTAPASGSTRKRGVLAALRAKVAEQKAAVEAAETAQETAQEVERRTRPEPDDSPSDSVDHGAQQPTPATQAPGVRDAAPPAPPAAASPLPPRSEPAPPAPPVTPVAPVAPVAPARPAPARAQQPNAPQAPAHGTPSPRPGKTGGLPFVAAPSPTRAAGSPSVAPDPARQGKGPTAAPHRSAIAPPPAPAPPLAPAPVALPAARSAAAVAGPITSSPAAPTASAAEGTPTPESGPGSQAAAQTSEQAKASPAGTGPSGGFATPGIGVGRQAEQRRQDSPAAGRPRLPDPFSRPKRPEPASSVQQAPPQSEPADESPGATAA